MGKIHGPSSNAIVNTDLSPHRDRLFLWVSLLAIGLLFFWHLGARGLNDPDEGRYAGVALRMLNTGDWLHPVFNGKPHLAKPPLTYWMIAASFALFGATEWAARLPATLAALAVVLLTASLSRRWFGPRRARDTVLILASAPLFFGLARLTDPNMLLTLWVLLAFWSWLTWQTDGDRWRRWLFYAALGLGFFTKGPVSVVLALFGIWSFRRWGGETYRARPTWSWPGALLAAGLGLWWFLLLVSQQPELFRYFIGTEIYARLFSPKLHRNEPIFYFLVILPAGFLPWLPLTSSLFCERCENPWPGTVRALAVWIAAAVTLFTCSQSKLPTYILPLMPPLALLATAALDRQTRCSRREWRGQRVYTLLLGIGSSVALFYLCDNEFHHELLVHPGIALCLIGIGFTGWNLLRRIDWLPWAAALIAIGYIGLLDIGYRHQEERDSNLTAKHLLELARANERSREEPIYFTHAPASLYFYLRPQTDPVRWDSNTHPSEDSNHLLYASQVQQQLDRLVAPTGLLFADRTRYDQSRAAGAPWRHTRELARNRRYVALQIE